MDRDDLHSPIKRYTYRIAFMKNHSKKLVTLV